MRASSRDIIRQRLRNQRLVGTPFATTGAAVASFGAVQSQDYTGAKWAIGQRTAGVTEDDLDRLFDRGAILRTHVLRPTWHFVTPTDIRWLIALTGPRIRSVLAHDDRTLGLDGPFRARCARVLERALRDDKYRT